MEIHCYLNIGGLSDIYELTLLQVKHMQLRNLNISFSIFWCCYNLFLYPAELAYYDASLSKMGRFPPQVAAGNQNHRLYHSEPAFPHQHLPSITFNKNGSYECYFRGSSHIKMSPEILKT